MSEPIELTERLAAAHRLLSTLRAGRARVEGLASQHLPFSSLVGLYDLGLGEDLIDDARRVGDQLEQQIAAWRLVRGQALGAALSADSLRRPAASSMVVVPQPPAMESVLRAPEVEETPEAHVTADLDVPRAHPEASMRVPDEEPVSQPVSQPEPEPDVPVSTEIGSELISWHDAELVSTQPPPLDDEEEPLYLGPPSTPAAPARVEPEPNGFVAFDDEGETNESEDSEEEYDPWAARRAAVDLSDQGPSEHADPDRDAGSEATSSRGVAFARVGPSPRLASTYEDELDTLNDYSQLSGSTEDADDQATSDANSGPITIGVEGVTHGAEPEPPAPAPEVNLAAPRVAGPATIDRVVLSAEQETGSFTPIPPTASEALSQELLGVPAGEDLSAEMPLPNARAVGSNRLRVGARPTPPAPVAPVVGPRLTDESASDQIPAQIEIVGLPEVDQVALKSAVAMATDAEAKGDLAGAIMAYGDAIDISPDRAEFWLGRGRCHLELGDYSAAMSDFQRSEDLAPGKAEPLVEMGNLYFARKEYGRAIEFYDNAIELDGALAMARCRRGMCHHYRRNHKAAFQDLQRAYALDPDIPNIRKYVQMAVKAMERDRPVRR